jgi:hypothetical protein
MKEPQTWVRAIMLITIAAVADALANAAVGGGAATDRRVGATDPFTKEEGSVPSVPSS